MQCLQRVWSEKSCAFVAFTLKLDKLSNRQLSCEIGHVALREGKIYSLSTSFCDSPLNFQ